MKKIVFKILNIFYRAVRQKTHVSHSESDPVKDKETDPAVMKPPVEPSTVIPVPGYKPKQFNFAFSAADFEAISNIASIRVGSAVLSCSLIKKRTSSVTLRIDQTEYAYRIWEEFAAHDYHFSVLQKITINGEPFYLYFCEIPNRNNTMGYKLFYTKSEIVYENMKYGQNPNSDIVSPYLKSFGWFFGGYSDTLKYTPYIMIALLRQRKISWSKETGIILE